MNNKREENSSFEHLLQIDKSILTVQENESRLHAPRNEAVQEHRKSTLSCTAPSKHLAQLLYSHTFDSIHHCLCIVCTVPGNVLISIYFYVHFYIGRDNNDIYLTYI